MKLLLRNFLLLALMIGSSVFAVALKSTQMHVVPEHKIDLETMLPKDFGEWHQDFMANAQVIDPQQQQTIDRIYSQTLVRTYVNAQGYRVMLSLAYGQDQRDSMQIHKPEVCYPAQGFTLDAKRSENLQIAGVQLPVTRLSTSFGNRFEPITYWILVGDQVVTGGIQKKVVEIGYRIHGSIPDGMLVRVSSIDTDTQNAYDFHERFITDLLASVDDTARHRLLGAKI